MRVLNDLHHAMQKRREERRLYRVIRNLDPELARDIGVVQDHVSRRARLLH